MLFQSRNNPAPNLIYAETFEEVDLDVYERFKYKISKHNYLPLCIARFVSKTIIFPEILECHPKTTLDDIEIED